MMIRSLTRRVGGSLLFLAAAVPAAAGLIMAMPVLIVVWALVQAWWPVALIGLVLFMFVAPEVNRLRYVQDKGSAMVQTRAPKRVDGGGSDTLF